MLFNSFSFAIFLPVVLLLYWFATKRSLRLQNVLLLVASYYFYACWDYRFLFLLIFSTLLDYVSAIKISQALTLSGKRFWFWLAIGINLSFLGVFKYFNFFSTSFRDSLSFLGIHADNVTLEIILPIGISFYTFHGLSYVIDIYKERIKPERNLIDYSLFVSFFPLLVAGPIERATHLLPQIKAQRNFDYNNAVSGLRQILWGFFKKVVIADNCAEYANLVFNNSSDYSGSTLVLGALFFAFQIYCDFSGYSDIAIGTARLFGIDLLRNFAYPYFSRDIAEFWRRWHISLSTWFRDYVYIPLGGNKGTPWVNIRNIFVIFLVSGFWHGANWTFIFWGFLNALYFLPLLLLKRNRENLAIAAPDSHLPSLRELRGIIFTFALTVLAWIFFRAENLTHAFSMISEIFSRSLLTVPYFPRISTIGSLLILICFLIIVEWIGRREQFALESVRNVRWSFVRKGIYYTIVGLIFFFGSFEENQFIYFQF
jgi:alginate O-acetyltransferase complex protein AlgI